MKRHICNTDHLNLAIVQRFSRPSFTGKETDCETGFSYFGARHYDPTLLTSWMSVDSMSDNYPSLSPYHYCVWNPMKLVDLDGKEAGIPPEISRFGRGLAQSVGGILTIGGGLVIGIGASETTVGPVIGFGLICDGFYATSQGLHQMANVITGRPESEDPKYSSVAGEITDNKTVDNVVSGVECIAGNAANSIVKTSTRKAATTSAAKTASSASNTEATVAKASKKPTTGTVVTHVGSAACTGIGFHNPSTTSKPSSTNGQSNTSTIGKPRNCNELVNP